ncbi:MAG: amidase family protein, partial [Desulfobacterota bacterium]|nr:amidase family protein [Thermodesulfobacteriota bacterium]
MELYTLTIYEAHLGLKKRKFSARELTEALMKRIEKVEPQIKAYINLTPEKAFQQAEEADKKIASGDMTLLTGIPLAVKDVICTR